MRHAMDLTRRALLGRMGLAAGVCASSSFAALAMHGGAHGMKKIAPNWASPNFNPDVDMELTCRPSESPILEGRATGVWRYAANLLKGPENTLTTLPDSYLGPHHALPERARRYASVCAMACPSRRSPIGTACMCRC